MMATAVIVGTVIGSGVFKKPQSVAENVPQFGLVALAWRGRIWTPLVLTAGGLALFCISPRWKLPYGRSRELEWSWVQQLIGSCYVWFGLAVLVYAASSRAHW